MESNEETSERVGGAAPGFEGVQGGARPLQRPSEAPRGPGGLGSWVNNQRYLRKMRGKGMNAGRVQKLEQLGFQWGAHCNTSQRNLGGLGIWVVHDPHLVKEGSRYHVDGQTKKLEDVQFCRQDDFEDRSLSKAAVGSRVEETATEDNPESTKLSCPMQQGGNQHKSNTCAEPARSSHRGEAVEQTR